MCKSAAQNNGASARRDYKIILLPDAGPGTGLPIGVTQRAEACALAKVGPVRVRVGVLLVARICVRDDLNAAMGNPTRGE